MPQAAPHGFDRPFDSMQQPPQQHQAGAAYGGAGAMHGHLHQQGQQGQQGQHPRAQPMSMGMHGGPGVYAPHANAQGVMGQAPHTQPMYGQPSWTSAAPPRPRGLAALTRMSPQVLILLAAGIICLAIFIIGIVLFVTTKF
jgi:hypothetical protein